MRKFVLAIAALAMAVAPIVATADGDDSEATVGSYYVDLDTPGVFEESNGDAGLQTSAHTHTDAEGNVTTIPADNQVA